jgi:hypothetical protein
MGTLLRAVFALLQTPIMRSHECERGTQKCVRYASSAEMRCDLDGPLATMEPDIQTA